MTKIKALLATLALLVAPLGLVAVTQEAASARTQPVAAAPYNNVQLSFSNGYTNGQLTAKNYMLVTCAGGAQHVISAPNDTSNYCWRTAYVQSRNAGSVPIGMQCYWPGSGWVLHYQGALYVGDTLFRNCRLYIM